MATRRIAGVVNAAILLIAFAALCVFSAVRIADGQSFPFPQHVAYSAPHIKPNAFSQTQLDDHVKAFYDYWKPTYLKSAGNNDQGKPMYKVYKDNSGRTVSEGQGYGMMITAYMAGYDSNAQALFDGLYYFVKKFPSQFNANNMKWNINPDNTPAYQDSAYDGDADITFGLLLAAKQWPNGGGEFNYLTEAQARMNGMKDTTGPTSFLPKLGDWVNNNDGKYNEKSPRVSDFMYGHFLAFSSFHSGQSAFWNSVLSSTKTVLGSLQTNFAPNTGLLPDFAQYDSGNSRYRPADSGFLEGSNDPNYNYNAGRIPWRLGVYSLNTNDATAKSQTIKIANWIKTQSSVQAGYTLSGSPLANYFTTFFAAPFAVSAMLDTSAQTWLNSIYSQIYQKHEAYYEDSVNMLCLIALSGNWWQPSSGAVGVSPSPVTGTRSPSPTPNRSPPPSPSPPANSVVWASGVNVWWIGVAFTANSVSIDCGRGMTAMTRASWNINGTPVWLWEGYGYQCTPTVQFNVDGSVFSANLPL